MYVEEFVLNLSCILILEHVLVDTTDLTLPVIQFFLDSLISGKGKKKNLFLVHLNSLFWKLPLLFKLWQEFEQFFCLY